MAFEYEINLKFNEQSNGKEYEHLVQADFSDAAARLVSDVLTHYFELIKPREKTDKDASQTERES